MYQVGWAKSEITGLSTDGYAMFGWGMWHNRATGQRTPLFARTFAITDNKKKTAIICCLDLGYITFPMRDGVIQQLTEKLGSSFDENAFVMTATHTHSGPGGCSQESLYNVVTPGYLPDHVQAIINATVESVLAAMEKRQTTDMSLTENPFAENVGVAWNRSVAAYNKNPEVIKKKLSETHLAIDRNMRVLGFEREGQLASLISIFGVHATCVGNTHSEYNGDNKGYAAAQAEKILAESHDHDEPVAIFAQGTAGDVSPYFQGKGDIAKRAKLNKEDQIAYAKHNARLQSSKALTMLEKSKHGVDTKTEISGDIDAVMVYVDFTDVKADPTFAKGKDDAFTADPCIGVSMFEGTRVDGPGMPKAIGLGARFISRRVQNMRLAPISPLSKEDKIYYKKLYKAHGKKDILMEGARKISLGAPVEKMSLPDFIDPTMASLKQQAKSGAMKTSPMLPTVLPLQIIRIGQLAFVCCPGEITTISGQRIRNTVAETLAKKGQNPVEQVVLISYCNEYMGYITTNEEYQTQHYEGGHTAYGQWTQAAFQTKFNELANELATPATKRSVEYKAANAKRPDPMPEEELALRTNLPVPEKW